MIQKVEMYRAVCDGCGRFVSDNNGTIINTPSMYLLKYTTLASGWLIDRNKLYCPCCVEYDKETHSYKSKEKKQ